MIKQADGQGNTVYKYPKCPMCGSKKRHHEEMSNKAIKQGTVEAGFLMPFTYESRPVADDRKTRLLPMGAEVPAITTATEVCMKCGCVYASLVVHGKVKKVIVDKQGRDVSKPKIILPGQ